MNQPAKPTALVILHPGFEEIEGLTPVDLLRRADIEVITTSLGDSLHVTGKNRIGVHADREWDSIAGQSFDCIILPGGPGTAEMRKDPRIHALLQAQNERGGWIAAICAAPLALLDAGVLSGRKFTGHRTIAEELPELDTRATVVIDQNLITSRGAGTAIRFSLAIIELLKNSQTSQSVASSIHWTE